jgi:integrase
MTCIGRAQLVGLGLVIGSVALLEHCGLHIDGMVRAGARAKAIYRSNFANPAATRLLQGESMLEVARMDDEVTHLLNTTLGGYQDVYRGRIRRIIVGTLDECVRWDTLPCHTLTGIELAPDRDRRAVRGRAGAQEDGDPDRPDDRDAGRRPHRHDRDQAPPHLGDPRHGIAPRLQRTMGLRIREALGVRKSDFKERSDGTRYLHLCWQASPDGRELEPLKHRKAGEYRDVPVPDMIWDMVAKLPDGPLCPGPNGTSYMLYNTAYSRLASLTRHLGITGARTHMLRHRFASEALDANPRELANISQVLGHDSVETTLKFYIHPSANAEQHIDAMMNTRWNPKQR